MTNKGEFICTICGVKWAGRTDAKYCGDCRWDVMQKRRDEANKKWREKNKLKKLTVI